MNGFNIVKVIERYKLQSDVVAKILFPKAKHSGLAFMRILENKASMDIVQLERLANYIGVPPGDLFYMGDWQYRTEDTFLTFIKDDFKVILNRGGYFLTVLKGHYVIEQIVANNEALTIKQFIDFINALISKHEDGNNCKSSD